MAEDLGQAQLTLTVNLDKFRDDLRNAKRLVESELGDAGIGNGRSRRSGSQQSTAAAEARAERARQRRVRNEQREVARRGRQGGARENTRALEVAQEKRFRIARRIDDLEERGADVARLRNRLGQLTDAQSKRQFGTFRQISQELARQVTLEERRVIAQRRQQRAAQQSASVGARNGGARESVNALQDAQDRRFRLSQRINRLEDRGVKVDKLRSQLGDLTTSYSQRQFGTAKQLSRELGRQVTLTEARAKREREIQQALDRRARAGGARSPIKGSKSIPDSPAFLDAQRKLQAKQLSRAAQIGGPREPIQGRKDLPGSPAFLRAQVKRSSQLYQRYLDEQAKELARSARAGGPSSPISGKLPNGVRIPGSPAAKGRELDVKNNWKVFLDKLVETKDVIDKESTKASARLKGPALPVSGRLINGQVVPGSPADLQQRTNGTKPRGASSPISGRLPGGGSIPGSPAALGDAEKKLADARRKVEADTRRLSKEETKRTTDRRKKVGEAVGSGIIGGAFPALFGQGAGASLGGALGGLGGGALGGQFGFGLSLVGTALGQAFDTALQKGQDLAKGLDDPIGNFQLLADAALFSSKAVEKNVGSLIAAGREEEAAIAARRDLSQQFGSAENARAFTEATDELNRAWTQATVSLTAFVAGPLADFLKSLAVGLGGSSEQKKAEADNARAMELVNKDPKLRQQFVDLAKQRGVSLDSNLQVGAGDLTKRVELVKEFLQLQGELTGAQREQQQLDAASADAAKRRSDIEKLTLGIIEDQASGNRTGELEKTKRLLGLQQTKELNILPSNATAVDRQAVRDKFARELLKVDKERLALQRELNLTIDQESAKRNEIAQQLGVATAKRDAALAAADSAANPGNSTLAARAGQLEGVSFLSQNRLREEQAITNERQLQAQYAQESDSTKRSQLAEQLKTAADEIRLAGEEAGAALAERAASAAQSLRSAQDSLRSTLQGNFRLLPGAQRQSLLAQAQADVERGRNTGIIRDTFRTSSRRRLFETADFIRNVEQQTAQVAQQQALVDALNQNTNAERNIRINVTMNADGTFNVNQTEQQAALL